MNLYPCKMKIGRGYDLLILLYEGLEEGSIGENETQDAVLRH